MNIENTLYHGSKIINRIVKKQPKTASVDRKEVLLSEIKDLLENQQKWKQPACSNCFQPPN